MALFEIVWWECGVPVCSGGIGGETLVLRLVMSALTRPLNLNLWYGRKLLLPLHTRPVCHFVSARLHSRFLRVTAAIFLMGFPCISSQHSCCEKHLSLHTCRCLQVAWRYLWKLGTQWVCCAGKHLYLQLVGAAHAPVYPNPAVLGRRQESKDEC